MIKDVYMIQQAIDACIKFISDPENFVVKNHTHTMSEIIDLTEFINKKFSEFTGCSIVLLKDGENHHDIVEPKESIIYFEKVTDDETYENLYNEYMYVNEKWELIGNTKIDLSQYYTKDLLFTKKEIENLLKGKVSTVDIAKDLSDNTKITTIAIVDKIVSDAIKKIEVSGGNIPVDSSLSLESENPVQNKVISKELEKKLEANDIANLIDSETFSIHVNDKVLHITEEERQKWNSVLEDAKKYIDQTFSNIDKFSIIVLSDGVKHESITKPDSSVLYFEKADLEEGNSYIEYMYVNEKWELIGSNTIDLSQYYTKDEVYDKTEVDSKMEELRIIINGISDSISENKKVVDDLKTSVDTHIVDTSLHVSSEEKTKWNGLETSLNKAKEDIASHETNADIHITVEEREKWNNKQTAEVEISSEQGNIIENKVDGLYASGPDLNVDEIIAKINGTISFLDVRTDSAETTIYPGTDPKITFDQVENINGIEYDAETGKITLKKGHTYCAFINLRISGLESIDKQTIGYTLYNETKNNNTGFGLVYPNNMPDINGWSGIEYVNIIEPGDVDCVYTPTIIEHGSNKVNIAKNSRMVIFEISQNITNNVTYKIGETEAGENSSDTPIGTIIPYMGTTAPNHYLICDGTEYNISEYQKLADFINENYGSYNHFGGDGINTFAVPDLRGEFIRGAGKGNISSGIGANVGKHQDATLIPYIGANTTTTTCLWTATSEPNAGGAGINPLNVDSIIYGGNNSTGYEIKKTGTWNSGSANIKEFTARPTNTSVNFCIKYENTPYLNIHKKTSLFDETVLFEGNAETIGNYTMIDNVNNYDYLFIEVSSYHNNSTFAPSSNNNMAKNTRLIRVKDTLISKEPKNNGEQICISMNYNSSWYYFLSFWFNTENSFWIDETYSAGYKTPGIRKIIGLKAVDNTTDTNK